MAIYESLNAKQREAVEKTEGPVLILAGAGSGKTRVLTHRIAWLIEKKGVNPWNILAITFTNKAAGEMKQRVQELVGFGSESIWVSTFHSACARILRRYIDRIGYGTDFSIYDAEDSKTTMKAVLKQMNVDTKRWKEKMVLSVISSAKNSLLDPQAYEKETVGDYAGELLSTAYREYQKTLKQNNALDFDDLIMKTVELFLSCPEVLASYQERFRYIHVDEYQDTNKAQFELIRLLSGRYRNLCVVGDDDQSIYRFRGADIRNILDFEKVFPEAAVIRLEQNYRSTQNILDAANGVIRYNISRKEKRLWTDKGRGEKIHFSQFDTAYDEAAFVAASVSGICQASNPQTLTDEGQMTAAHTGEETGQTPIGYGEVAVLYRTNAQSRLLEEAFVREGIPYDLVGGVNFYARREIKDILAYLKTIDNARDDLAVRRIINVPRRGIGAATIERVQSYADARGMSFYEALCEADQIMSIGRSAEKLKSFVTMIRAFRTRAQMYGLSALLKDVIDTTGYAKELEESLDEEDKERLQNLDELYNKAVVFEEANEDASLSAFLEEVALVADIDNVEEGNNRVLLMTLHAAKGLEFTQVFITGMEDGLFPGYAAVSSGSEADMEEERRLAYVGITRAKKSLMLTCARRRMQRGEMQYYAVSRFVREIPPELLDTSLPGSYRTNEPQNAWLIGDGYAEASQEDENVVFFPGASDGRLSSSWRDKQDTSGSFRTDSGRLPRATRKSRRTPEEKKPYILKAMSGGQKPAGNLNGLSTGAQMERGVLDYGVGDRVRHKKFGEGVVTAIEDTPRDYQVTVEFDRAGTKIMYAAFAKLEKL